MRNRNLMVPKFIRDLLGCIQSMRSSAYPIKRTHHKIGRNETCRCNSGKRYKHCHWSEDVRKGVR